MLTLKELGCINYSKADEADFADAVRRNVNPEFRNDHSAMRNFASMHFESFRRISDTEFIIGH